MLEKKWSLSSWVDLLCRFHDAGIQQLHVSPEYDSFALVAEVLREFRARRPGDDFGCVVKIAEPSFDDDNFSADRLTEKCARAATALGMPTVDVVQWMWRQGLSDERRRCDSLAEARPDLDAAFLELRAVGLAGDIVCFPYTPEFAEVALSCAIFHGLAVYRNPREREYDDVVERCDAAGMSVVALRPFFAGAAFDGTPNADALLRYALAPPAVAAVVVTASEPAHVDALVEFVVGGDEGKFGATVAPSGVRRGSRPHLRAGDAAARRLGRLRCTHRAGQTRSVPPVARRRDGRPFTLYKFRTMDDTRNSEGHLLADSERTPPLGRLLRRTSLDELPSLFNVVRGDMALVGPRPFVADYLHLYSSEHARRHDVRPGVTGWAQVNGRNALSWQEKFDLDLWYVAHRSLRLDISILLKTAALVLRPHRAPMEGDVAPFDGYGAG